MLKNNLLLVDFEGYYYFDKFFIKEFGFYSDSIKTIYIKTKPKKFSNYFWLLKHYHRILHHFGKERFSTVLDTLNQRNIIILVKGLEKAKILSKLTNNLVLNLEDFGCPSFNLLTTDADPCIYHAIVPSIHCVKTKISKLLNWIKD